VSPFLCQASSIISQLITLYTGVLLVYALISWLPSLRGRWTEYVAMIVEPVLTPLRKVIPPFAGLDLSFMVLLLLLRFIQQALVVRSCYVA
jgi:YggT family protein